MAIASSNLIFYASASKPMDDSSSVGGAIDLKTKILSTVEFEDQIEILSSSSLDVQKLYVYGRAKSGHRAVRVIDLLGTTVVRDRFHFDTILDLRLTSDAVGTITIRKASTDVTFVSISAGSKGYTSFFKYSRSSEGQTRTRYDKCFLKNNHATDSLFNSSLYLSSVDEDVEFGLDLSIDATLSSSNRLTSPSGITFSSDLTNTPTANLANGKAIGIWLKQTLLKNSLPESNDLVIAVGGSTS